MEIRPARFSDAPALARVHVDSWRAAYSGLATDSQLQSFTYARREERFRQSLAAGAEETYLGTVAGEVIGFLTLGAARDPDLAPDRTGEIWGIYISPDNWRTGIGTRLADEAERLLTSQGYGDAVLWVLQDNRRARRFYEAMGFSPDGGSKFIDWGKPLKAVRYRKALQPAPQNDP